MDMTHQDRHENTPRAFLEHSAELLADSFMPRIRRAVERLGPEDVWWRPNEASNSVGNLLLHLAGNLRQWVVSGVGGAEDTRARAHEFAARGVDAEARRDGEDAAALLDRLEGVVAEAAGVLRSTDPDALEERRTVQGREVTVLEAVYHAVEHFSRHTGQILYIAKLRGGEDLGLYEVDASGTAEPRW